MSLTTSLEREGPTNLSPFTQFSRSLRKIGNVRESTVKGALLERLKAINGLLAPLPLYTSDQALLHQEDLRVSKTSHSSFLFFPNAIDEVTRALFTPLYLKHISSEVQLLTLSCLADIIRLSVAHSSLGTGELHRFFSSLVSFLRSLSPTNSSEQDRLLLFKILDTLTLSPSLGEIILDLDKGDSLVESFCNAFYELIRQSDPAVVLEKLQAEKRTTPGKFRKAKRSKKKSAKGTRNKKDDGTKNGKHITKKKSETSRQKPKQKGKSIDGSTRSFRAQDKNRDKAIRDDENDGTNGENDTSDNDLSSSSENDEKSDMTQSESNPVLDSTDDESLKDAVLTRVLDLPVSSDIIMASFLSKCIHARGSVHKTTILSTILGPFMKFHENDKEEQEISSHSLNLSAPSREFSFSLLILRMSEDVLRIDVHQMILSVLRKIATSATTTVIIPTDSKGLAIPPSTLPSGPILSKSQIHDVLLPPLTIVTTLMVHYPSVVTSLELTLCSLLIHDNENVRVQTLSSFSVLFNTKKGMLLPALSGSFPLLLKTFLGRAEDLAAAARVIVIQSQRAFAMINPRLAATILAIALRDTDISVRLEATTIALSSLHIATLPVSLSTSSRTKSRGKKGNTTAKQGGKSKEGEQDKKMNPNREEENETTDDFRSIRNTSSSSPGLGKYGVDWEYLVDAASLRLFDKKAAVRCSVQDALTFLFASQCTPLLLQRLDQEKLYEHDQLSKRNNEENVEEYQDRGLNYSSSSTLHDILPLEESFGMISISPVVFATLGALVNNPGVFSTGYWSQKNRSLRLRTLFPYGALPLHRMISLWTLLLRMVRAADSSQQKYNERYRGDVENEALSEEKDSKSFDDGHIGGRIVKHPRLFFLSTDGIIRAIRETFTVTSHQHRRIVSLVTLSRAMGKFLDRKKVTNITSSRAQAQTSSVDDLTSNIVLAHQTLAKLDVEIRALIPILAVAPSLLQHNANSTFAPKEILVLSSAFGANAASATKVIESTSFSYASYVPIFRPLLISTTAPSGGNTAKTSNTSTTGSTDNSSTNALRPAQAEALRWAIFLAKIVSTIAHEASSNSTVGLGSFFSILLNPQSTYTERCEAVIFALPFLSALEGETLCTVVDVGSSSLPRKASLQYSTSQIQRLESLFPLPLFTRDGALEGKGTTKAKVKSKIMQEEEGGNISVHTSATIISENILLAPRLVPSSHSTTMSSQSLSIIPPAYSLASRLLSLLAFGTPCWGYIHALFQSFETHLGVPRPLPSTFSSSLPVDAFEIAALEINTLSDLYATSLPGLCACESVLGLCGDLLAARERALGAVSENIALAHTYLLQQHSEERRAKYVELCQQRGLVPTTIFIDSTASTDMSVEIDLEPSEEHREVAVETEKMIPSPTNEDLIALLGAPHRSLVDSIPLLDTVLHFLSRLTIASPPLTFPSSAKRTETLTALRSAATTSTAEIARVASLALVNILSSRPEEWEGKHNMARIPTVTIPLTLMQTAMVMEKDQIENEQGMISGDPEARRIVLQIFTSCQRHFRFSLNPQTPAQILALQQTAAGLVSLSVLLRNFPQSVVHIVPDTIQMCITVLSPLQSPLPQDLQADPIAAADEIVWIQEQLVEIRVAAVQFLTSVLFAYSYQEQNTNGKKNIEKTSLPLKRAFVFGYKLMVLFSTILRLDGLLFAAQIDDPRGDIVRSRLLLAIAKGMIEMVQIKPCSGFIELLPVFPAAYNTAGNAVQTTTNTPVVLPPNDWLFLFAMLAHNAVDLVRAGFVDLIERHADLLPLKMIVPLALCANDVQLKTRVKTLLKHILTLRRRRTLLLRRILEGNYLAILARKQQHQQQHQHHQQHETSRQGSSGSENSPVVLLSAIAQHPLPEDGLIDLILLLARHPDFQEPEVEGSGIASGPAGATAREETAAVYHYFSLFVRFYVDVCLESTPGESYDFTYCLQILYALKQAEDVTDPLFVPSATTTSTSNSDSSTSSISLLRTRRSKLTERYYKLAEITQLELQSLYTTRKWASGEAPSTTVNTTVVKKSLDDEEYGADVELDKEQTAVSSKNKTTSASSSTTVLASGISVKIHLPSILRKLSNVNIVKNIRFLPSFYLRFLVAHSCTPSKAPAYEEAGDGSIIVRHAGSVTGGGIGLTTGINVGATSMSVSTEEPTHGARALAELSSPYSQRTTSGRPVLSTFTMPFAPAPPSQEDELKPMEDSKKSSFTQKQSQKTRRKQDKLGGKSGDRLSSSETSSASVTESEFEFNPLSPLLRRAARESQKSIRDRRRKEKAAGSDSEEGSTSFISFSRGVVKGNMDGMGPATSIASSRDGMKFDLQGESSHETGTETDDTDVDVDINLENDGIVSEFASSYDQGEGNMNENMGNTVVSSNMHSSQSFSQPQSHILSQSLKVSISSSTTNSLPPNPEKAKSTHDLVSVTGSELERLHSSHAAHMSMLHSPFLPRRRSSGVFRRTLPSNLHNTPKSSSMRDDTMTTEGSLGQRNHSLESHDNNFQEIEGIRNTQDQEADNFTPSQRMTSPRRISSQRKNSSGFSLTGLPKSTSGLTSGLLRGGIDGSSAPSSPQRRHTSSPSLQPLQTSKFTPTKTSPEQGLSARFHASSAASASLSVSKMLSLSSPFQRLSRPVENQFITQSTSRKEDARDNSIGNPTPTKRRQTLSPLPHEQEGNAIPRSHENITVSSSSSVMSFQPLTKAQKTVKVSQPSRLKLSKGMDEETNQFDQFDDSHSSSSSSLLHPLSTFSPRSARSSSHMEPSEVTESFQNLPSQKQPSLKSGKVKKISTSTITVTTNAKPSDSSSLFLPSHPRPRSQSTSFLPTTSAKPFDPTQDDCFAISFSDSFSNQLSEFDMFDIQGEKKTTTHVSKESSCTIFTTPQSTRRKSQRAIEKVEDPVHSRPPSQTSQTSQTSRQTRSNQLVKENNGEVGLDVSSSRSSTRLQLFNAEPVVSQMVDIDASQDAGDGKKSTRGTKNVGNITPLRSKTRGSEKNQTSSAAGNVTSLGSLSTRRQPPQPDTLSPPQNTKKKDDITPLSRRSLRTRTL